jgi:hypothetical protein
MLKEFVEAIGKLAVDARQPVMVGDRFDPRKAYLIHAGKIEEKAVAPPLLNSRVDTLESLDAAVGKFAQGDASAWCSRECVEVVLDSEDRLERIRLPLFLSDQMKAVLTLPRSFSQKDLVLFLKRNMAGAIDPAEIAPFRQLDFTKREAAGGVVKHGEESLGRSVQAAVAQASEIPEFLVVNVRVYANPDIVFRTNINLSVDIDLQRGVIDLTPLPDEIVYAFESAENHVFTAVSDQLDGDATMFRGTPTMVHQAVIAKFQQAE